MNGRSTRVPPPGASAARIGITGKRRDSAMDADRVPRYTCPHMQASGSLPAGCASPAVDEALVYPADHHFRIITVAGSGAYETVSGVLTAYQVVAPLTHGQTSQGGRYQSLSVTVRLASRAEHMRLDGALRQAEGVRILL
ncbi:MAG: DUF493 family protein [Kiritimatiellae bacterium]|nr:DUF493 family protein [Kiritimatiellia bacterium]